MQETTQIFAFEIRDLTPVATLLASAESPIDGGVVAAVIPFNTGTSTGSVAIWGTAEGKTVARVVRDDESVVADDRLLREALTLIAMCESIDDQLSQDACARACEAARSVRDLAVRFERTQTDAGCQKEATLTLPLIEEAANVCTIFDGTSIGSESVETDDTQAVVATPTRLDQAATWFLGAEVALAQLEKAADSWSNHFGESHSGDMQQLWQSMGIIRSGILGQPVTQLIDAGRRAGESLFESLSDAN